MTDALELRPATPGDAHVVAETVLEGFKSFRDWAAPGWEPPPAERELEAVREELSRSGVWAVIALDGERVAGHVSFTQARERRPPRAEISGMAHLWQLFVRRPWWGSGLAGRLNAVAIEAAAARGYDRIRLHTPVGNARARAFYEREGWTTNGVAIPEPSLGMDLLEYRHPL